MSTTRIPAAPITGLYGALIKRFSIKMFGRVPEPLGVYFHNPAVLKSYLSVSTKSHKWHDCDPSLKSFAHMAVASMLGCSWCLDFGYFAAHSKGLRVDKLKEVPRWRESDVFTPVERRVLEYAEAMSVTPLTVTDAMADALRADVGVDGFVELTMMVAVENERSRFNSALGLTSQGFADRCELPRP